MFYFLHLLEVKNMAPGRIPATPPPLLPGSLYLALYLGLTGGLNPQTFLDLQSIILFPRLE